MEEPLMATVKGCRREEPLEADGSEEVKPDRRMLEKTSDIGASIIQYCHPIMAIGFSAFFYFPKV